MELKTEYEWLDLVIIGFLVFSAGIVSLMIFNSYMMLTILYGTIPFIKTAFICVAIGGLIILMGMCKKMFVKDGE